MDREVPATTRSQRSGQSLWTVTVDVFSPVVSLCGVWDTLGTPSSDARADPWLAGGEQPAAWYFDVRGGVRAWLAVRVWANEVEGARQRGQAFVDDLLSRAPGDVARHRSLRVVVRAAPATERSWEKAKWQLAPRAKERLIRPVRWAACKLADDDLTLTLVWSSGEKRVERIDTDEGLDRVLISLHEHRPPLLTAAGERNTATLPRRTRRVVVVLRRPLGLRAVCDGFDGAARFSHRQA